MTIGRKKELIKARVLAEHGQGIKTTKIHRMIDKMSDANIPAGYWFLTMDKFEGSPKLKEIVDDYVANLQNYYMEGRSICLAGNQGTGKTMSSICILKEALKKDFSAYYTTAADMLSDLSDKETSSIRSHLKNVDFLVIDELDSRFFTSDSMREFFSGKYELIFRHRAHNQLPTILCTNETQDILRVFYGPGVQSIDSLNNQYLKVYPVVGKDFRKRLADDSGNNA